MKHKGRVERAREDGAVCACGKVNYTLEPPPFNGAKPRFQCNECGNTWSCGHSGQPYMKYAIRK